MQTNIYDAREVMGPPPMGLLGGPMNYGPMPPYYNNDRMPEEDVSEGYLRALNEQFSMMNVQRNTQFGGGNGPVPYGMFLNNVATIPPRFFNQPFPQNQQQNMGPMNGMSPQRNMNQGQGRRNEMGMPPNSDHPYNRGPPMAHYQQQQNNARAFNGDMASQPTMFSQSYGFSQREGNSQSQRLGSMNQPMTQPGRNNAAMLSQAQMMSQQDFPDEFDTFDDFHSQDMSAADDFMRGSKKDSLQAAAKKYSGPGGSSQSQSFQFSQPY